MSQRQQRRLAEAAREKRAPPARWAAAAGPLTQGRDAGEDDEESVIPLAAPQGRNALFSLLQEEDSDDEREEGEEGEEEAGGGDGEAEGRAHEGTRVTGSPRESPKRRHSPVVASPLPPAVLSSGDSLDSEDDFGGAGVLGGLHSGRGGALSPLDALLLLAGPSRANGDAELARVFGRREGERRAGGAQGRRATGCSLVTPPQPETGRTRSPWPFVPAAGAVAGGLSMVASSPQSSVRTFAIVQAPEYERLVDAFEVVAGMGDTGLLMNWAQGHPFVLPCLLALVDYHATARAAEAAALHLRRALYVVERLLHPFFRPAEAVCRLPFSSSSRPLYTALFKAQASAARSGAIEASFELCRLLLQLSPPSDAPNGGEESGGDPQRVALLAGTAALRAGADTWVIEITGAETAAAGSPAAYVCCLRGSTLPLVHLPGWGLARARALFRVQEATAGKTGEGPAALRAAGNSARRRSAWLHADASFLVIPPTDASAVDAATRTLVRSLLILPHLLLPLLAQLGLKPSDKGVAAVLGDAATGAHKTGREGTRERSPLSPPTCAWRALFEHPLFARPWRDYERVRSGRGSSPHWPGDLEHLVTIAARRHSLVWRSGPALLWLHAAAARACEAHDAATALTAGDEGADVVAAAEALTAAELFRELFVSFLPHAGGDDTTDTEGVALHSTLRHYARAGPLADYTDELPQSMDVEEMEGAEWGGGGEPAARRRGRGQGCCRSTAAWGRRMAGGNPLLLFFASLLPGYAL